MKQASCPQQQRKIKVGAAVKATHGHDRGRLYLVIGRDTDQVHLSDGVYRPVTKPKAKNIKHLVHVSDLIEASQLIADLNAQSCEREKDIYIRRLLKQVAENEK
jgi:ribosomal protein L14E/L6E/L27E